MQCFSLFVGLSLSISAFACGDGDDPDAGPKFEKPQILPDTSPICLTPGYIPDFIRVGGVPRARPLQLLNRGAQTLQISSATFENTSANVFTVSGVSPMSIEYNEQAVAQLIYTPTQPGWDYGTFRIQSNAENYPNLEVFVLARAVPGDLDAGSEASWDAGPKPAAAFAANGEACPFDSGVR